MGQLTTSTRAGRVAVMMTAAALTFGVAGCGFASSEATVIAEINVSSPQLRDEAPLPADYSCKKPPGVSPPLRWSSEPLPKAKSIAIVADNSAPSESAVHWVLYNIDPRTTELGEDAASSPPDDSGQARVTGGKAGYEAPCSPTGNYRFTVYALSGRVDVKEGAPLPEILKKIADQTIARGRLSAVHIE